MIAKMNGWKVTVCNFGNLNSHNNFEIVNYYFNMKVCPNIKDSMLFFFPDRDDALRFINRYTNRRLVPCVAYGCKKIKKVAENGVDIPLFWKLKRNKKSTKDVTTMAAPTGSWVAKSIMLVK
jgi:hypothetical protein